jgi:hypothetical protein
VVATSGVGKTLRKLLVVLVLISVPVGYFVFRASRKHQPQTFVLRDGSKRTSKAWFYSWFAKDPSVDEIFAQYLKVSGWQAHPSALKTLIGRGHLQIKNNLEETYAATQAAPHLMVHVHWSTADGELEFESEAPNKLVVTQKFEDWKRVWQRGTNGAKGWSRKGWAEQSANVDPHIQLVGPVYTNDLGPRVADEVKRGGEFINYFQLENRYPNLRLLGKTLVGDRVAYQLTNLNFGTDGVSEMYFDVETGMLLRVDSRRVDLVYNPMLDEYIDPHGASGSEDAETYLEDYREVNGVSLPYRIRQKYQDVWITTTITELKVNEPIDPAVFEKPSHD